MTEGIIAAVVVALVVWRVRKHRAEIVRRDHAFDECSPNAAPEFHPSHDPRKPLKGQHHPEVCHTFFPGWVYHLPRVADRRARLAGRPGGPGRRAERQALTLDDPAEGHGTRCARRRLVAVSAMTCSVCAASR